MRSINDPVKVRFLGEIYTGKIIDIGGHARVLYQVLLNNPYKTQLWFIDDEVMNLDD